MVTNCVCSFQNVWCWCFLAAAGGADTTVFPAAFFPAGFSARHIPSLSSDLSTLSIISAKFQHIFPASDAPFLSFYYRFYLSVVVTRHGASRVRRYLRRQRCSMRSSPS
jgi:hypothetical protein